MTTYEIVQAERSEYDEFRGTRTGDWSNDLGGPNEFDTAEAAESEIANLRTLGDEWADAELRVRRIGERFPL